MNARAPQLLFLAFPFPPSRAIGAVRCANLAKYLTRLGWRVTVVTLDPRLLADPDPAVTDMAEAWCRDAGIHRVLTGHDYRMLYGGALKGRWWERPAIIRKTAGRAVRWLGMDPGVGWVRPAVAACAQFRPGDFDVILASGSPFPAFEAARRLSQRLEAPMVLDYRDLWSAGPHAHRRMPVRIERAERALLRQAAGVWTVSAGMARCMEDRFGGGDKRSVITNGFDPDEFRDKVPTRFAQPTIVYAGAFYPPLRVIDPVLDAVGMANRRGLPNGQEMRLLYLGPHSGCVRAVAKEKNASQWLDDGGNVSRSEVLSALKGSLAAVVITSVQDTASPAVDSILTGKLFEAMGAHAPVLLVAPPGTDAAQVVLHTRAGRAFAGKDAAGMADWIRQLAGGAEGRPGSDVDAYAWPQIARQADSALRKAMAR